MSRASEEIGRLEAEFHARLQRHRKRMLPFRVLAARPRFFVAIGAGAAAGLFCPDSIATVSRALIGWNVAALCYLALVLGSIRRSTHHYIRLQAQMLDDGRFFVLTLSVLAAVAAIGAIVVELAAAKDVHGADRIAHLLLAGMTIVSSWFFIHMVFALHYAHEYYLERESSGADDSDEATTSSTPQFATSGDTRGGLIFPGSTAPGYLDFAYFSYVIGVASQTADVSICSRPMRAVSLAHSILSFFFNTTILALTINLAAGLF